MQQGIRGASSSRYGRKRNMCAGLESLWSTTKSSTTTNCLTRNRGRTPQYHRGGQMYSSFRTAWFHCHRY
jgi:hypothetical protein